MPTIAKSLLAQDASTSVDTLHNVTTRNQQDSPLLSHEIPSLSRPVALLLRHAERPPLSPGLSGHNLPITAAGSLQAYALGQDLGPHLRAIRSSPVPRCVQTAIAILDVAQSKLPLRQDSYLGDPGPFVTDPKLGWDSFLTFGQDHIFRFVVEGQGAIPGFADPLAAATSFLSYLLSTLEPSPGFYVYVSHDLVLAGLLARLFRLPVLDNNWPSFLETVALWQDDPQNVQLAFRHHRLSRPV